MLWERRLLFFSLSHSHTHTHTHFLLSMLWERRLLPLSLSPSLLLSLVIFQNIGGHYTMMWRKRSLTHTYTHSAKYAVLKETVVILSIYRRQRWFTTYKLQCILYYHHRGYKAATVSWLLCQKKPATSGSPSACNETSNIERRLGSGRPSKITAEMG